MSNALSHVGVIYLIYFQLIPASLILDPTFPGNRYQLPEADRWFQDKELEYLVYSYSLERSGAFLVMILAHLYPWILIHTLLPIIDGKMFPEWKSFVNRYKQHSRVNAPWGRGGTPHNCLYERARKGHLFQDLSMRKVFKVTRPSFFGGVTILLWSSLVSPPLLLS